MCGNWALTRWPDEVHLPQSQHARETAEKWNAAHTGILHSEFMEFKQSPRMIRMNTWGLKTFQEQQTSPTAYAEGYTGLSHRRWNATSEMQKSRPSPPKNKI